MKASWNTIKERAIGQYESGFPLVLYANPGEKKATAIFQKDAVSYTTTNFDDPGFAFVSFDGETKLMIPKPNSCVLEFTIEKPEIINRCEPKPLQQGKADFEKLVEKGISAIVAGAARLSDRESWGLVGFCVPDCLQANSPAVR